MKKLLLFQFIFFISFSIGLQAQCGSGEDTTAPVFGNAGDGTMASPFKNLLQSTVGSVPSGTYYFNFNGSTFQGALDNDTDGGGWLMVLNYVHLAGDNTDTTIRNTDLPLLGSSTVGDNEAGTANWGHMGNALATAIDFEEVRFYGETTGHNRIIDFKTSYINVLNYLKTGQGGFVGISTASNFTALSGHTANIPALANNQFFNQGDKALTEFPFWLSGQFHWGIRGGGSRWEVDDTALNTQSTIHRVWVRGDLSPTATTGLTTTLDNTGNITVTPADFGLAVTDNCSTEANITLSLSQTDFTCANLGANTIQLTATDEQNNSTVVDVMITILESPPVITVPGGFPFFEVELDSNGEVTLDLAILNTTITDDCGIASTTISQTDLNCTNVGFNFITISATDVNGNVTTENMIFTLVDNLPPVVQCIAPFSVELDATGSITLDPNSLIVSFTDNCSLGDVTLDKPVLTCADVGDNLITVTAADQGGNEVTCTTTVTVTIPACPGNLTLQAEADACGVTYNYPCASNITSGPASGTFLDVGTTTTYTYDTIDNTGATVSCSYDVTVVDTEGPDFITQNATFDVTTDGTVSITANDLLGPDPLASDYTVDQTGTFNREDISTTGTEVVLFDDQVSSALPIGFQFAFYGNLYNDFYISSNGFITFTDNSDDGCCEGGTLPFPVDPNNLIAFDWDDYDPSEGGTIRYETIGTAPNRMLIMEFDNVAHIDDNTQGSTTQVKLFETTNSIEIHATTIPDLANLKSQGIENIDGSAAIAVPGRNSEEWSATNDVVAFIPVSGILDSCGVDTLVASQTTFNCSDIGDTVVTVTATDVNNNITQLIATVTITDSNGYCNELPVEVKVMLQGTTINPNIGEELLMRDDLRVNNLIPLTSPYADVKTIDNTLLNVTGNDAIVDWIWVEIREVANPTNVVQGQSALIQRDGDIVSATDGTSPVVFNRLPDDYYLAVKHRNHLGIMTNTSLNFQDGISTIVDFTDANNPITFGANAQTTFGMPSDVLGMWAGNVNGDIQMRYQGSGNDSNSIKDNVLAEPSNTSNSNLYTYIGYSSADVDMNGSIRYQGSGNDSNTIKDIILSHPDNQVSASNLFVISEQLPEN